MLLLFLTTFNNVVFAATPDSVIDKMIGDFGNEFDRYGDIVHRAAMSLFAGLFLCQFAWSIIQLLLQESLTFGAVIATIIRQLMIGGVFWWLLFNRSILETIVASFKALSGENLELSQLAKVSVNLCRTVLTHTSTASGMIEGLYIGIVGLATCVVMSFSLTTAVGYLAIVMLENFIVGSLGLILLGFGGSEYTRNYALSYIKTLVHVGFKLFLVSVILVIGISAFYDIMGDWCQATRTFDPGTT